MRFGVFMLDDYKDLSNTDDNELVKLINNGEYKYFQVLLNRYMPYIISIASHYKTGGFDTDDFIQEGVLAIFSAVKSFDENKASFKTFVTVCINRALSSALTRVAGAAKHIPDALMTPIDSVVLPDMNNPETILIEKENYFDLEHIIKKELSSFEYQVLCEFISGKSYADIADVLNVSQKSVDNALKRVRLKIRSN